MRNNKAAHSKKKTGHWWHWILWWKTDAEKIQRQVAEYKELGIGSARGLALILLMISALMTSAGILFELLDTTALADVVILLVLGLFIYYGHRWAIVGAMIFWTIQKLYFLLLQTAVGGSGANPLSQVIWWTTYMHAFYVALVVENARRRPPSPLTSESGATAPITSHLSKLERIAELKEKGIITEEEFLALKAKVLDDA